MTDYEEEEKQAPEVKTVDARELIGDSGVLRITLDGNVYMLRLTRNERLILTK